MNKSLLYRCCDGRLKCCNIDLLLSGEHFHESANYIKNIKHEIAKREHVTAGDAYLICNGKLKNDYELVDFDKIYELRTRLNGGKGGFGSMLRAIGAQIEKTTNREACRDLSGRRLRDINNEQRLKDWMEKKAERERAEAARQKEKLEKLLAAPRHNFDDPNYHEERSAIQDNVQSAITEGLQASSSSVQTRKRKANSDSETKSRQKSQKLWLGGDMDDLELSESDDDGGDNVSDALGLVEAGSSSASCSGTCANSHNKDKVVGSTTKVDNGGKAMNEISSDVDSTSEIDIRDTVLKSDVIKTSL